MNPAAACASVSLSPKAAACRMTSPTKAPEATFYNGLLYVARATAMLPIDMEALLHQHGAPKDPFGGAPWLKRPFDVLKAAFEDALGNTIEL